MMKLYFAIWRIILRLPEPVKILVEMLIILSVMVILWPILRYAFWAFIKILGGFNYFIFGGARRMLAFLPRENVKIYAWDDRIGRGGYKINSWLKERASKVSKSKAGSWLKKKFFVVIFILVYIFAILPCFKLEKLVDDYYLKDVYTVHRFFGNVEKTLTKGIEYYPDLFIPVVKEASEEESEEEQKEEKPIYLDIEESISFANLRENADLDSSSLCVISKDDQIVYMNDYKKDDGRYWLRVMIPSQDNKEGWISEKVVSQESLTFLDLQ